MRHIVQCYYMGSVENPFGWFIYRYGDIGVDIFFVISGFVMASTTGKYNGRGLQYWLNRLIRVIPNYWFYTLLLVISLAVFPDGTYLTGWHGNSLLLSLLLIPNSNPNGYGAYPTLLVGWTLVYEMFFYLVLSLTLMINRSQYLAICSALLLVISIILKDVHFLGHSNYLLWEFVAGILIYKAYSVYRHTIPLLYINLVGFTITIIAYYYTGFGQITATLAASMTVLTFVSLERYIMEWSFVNFLQRLGDYSYSTYLCHLIVIGWFYGIFGNKVDRLAELSILSGIIVVVYICSAVTYNLIESGAFPKRLKEWSKILV